MKTALVFGDTHIPFADPAALHCIASLIKAAQPDVLVHNGDLVDCWSVSSFDKDPYRKSTLQEEIDEAAALLKRWRALAPKAACYLLEGNHEDRLRRVIWRMTDGQRELAQLRAFRNGLTWPSLLQLGDDWKFIPTQDQSHARLLPKLITKHGTVVRRWSAMSAKAEWERYGKSGLSGHTHRLGLFYTNDFNGAHVWAETGCTCSLKPEYTLDPNWQQGCVVITYVGERFAIEPVYIQGGVAVWRGREYR